MFKRSFFLVVLIVCLLAGFTFGADSTNATSSKFHDENGAFIEYTFTVEYSASDSTDILYTEAMWIGYFDPANFDINVSLWTTDATIVVLPTIQGCNNLTSSYFYTVSVGADTIEGTGQRTVNTILDSNDSGLPALYLRIALDGLSANPQTATVLGKIIVPKPEHAASYRFAGWVSTQ